MAGKVVEFEELSEKQQAGYSLPVRRRVVACPYLFVDGVCRYGDPTPGKAKDRYFFGGR